MSQIKEVIALVEGFEVYLGSPCEDCCVVNFNASIAADEKEELPLALMAYVRDWGYDDYLVPYESGGRLQSLLPLYLLSRSLSRRDLTLSVGLGLSFLSTLPIWIAGSGALKQQLAKRIRRGDTCAMALTEKEHGSDLMASDMKALWVNNQWQLSGAKWCVNYATVGQLATVLCRTRESGGVLGFSLFLVDKKAVTKGVTSSEKLPTLGVRGLDISGFSLNDIMLPASALVGEKHKGLEITLKALQISRVLCAQMSIGSADTALRLTLAFSLQRKLYQGLVYEIPVVKSRLGECFAYLLLADSMALAMVRACTLNPGRMSFWSAIVKFLIPTIAESIIDECSKILGARGYLRTTEWAIFQKMRRDSLVVGLFDGSSQVNLAIIAGNLVKQAQMRSKMPPVDTNFLASLFDLTQDVPDFTGIGLTVFNQGADEVLNSLLTMDTPLLKPLADLIYHEVLKLDETVLSAFETGAFAPQNMAAFRLAERYSWLFSAACVLNIWHYNRENLPEMLPYESSLTLIIQLILQKISGEIPLIDEKLQHALADSLCEFHHHNQLFSVLSIKVASL